MTTWPLELPAAPLNGRAAHAEPATTDVDVAPVAAPPARTSLDTVDWTRWYPALIGFVVAVVAVTFALSYHGLYEFAAQVAHLPWGLALVVPVGVDVFSLCSLVATFLTRDAPWRVRAYAWAMFGSTVAVSVAGNALFAIASLERREGVAGDSIHWGYMQVGAVVGAALWPAFSAGALHLLIIVRRHLEQQRAKVDQASKEAGKDAAAEQLVRARAIELAASGMSCSAIADDLGAPRRSVERWTEGIRSAMTPKPATPAARPAKTAPRKTAPKEATS